jgi:putative ABC transport system permease protein
MKLRRNVRLSLRALFSHRVRAVLALSSVCIGVAAVVLTSAVGAGAQREVRRSIENMGVNLLVVRPVLIKRFAGRKELKGAVTTLRVEDYQAIAQLPLVAAAAPGIEGPVRVKASASSMMTMIRGTGPAYPAVRRFQVARGRFFDADDDRFARRVVVLGARVADALFDADPVGREIRIRGVPFDVIGVLAAKGVVADGDQDNQVLVPVQTALRRVFNATWLNAVYLSVKEPETTTAAEGEIDALLRQRHRVGRDGQADFEIQNAARFFALQKKTADSLTKLSIGLAGIALVVGGVGIMGLMLLSVKERTVEIGLRMAVGAAPRDVLVQFLTEASVLALGGWTVGIILGVVGAATIEMITAWQIAAPAQAVLASFGMAVIIGLVFGAIPARAASMVPPVRALLAK